MMRQAGRTLPEYRRLKDVHSFWEMCRTPELACEVTLQPLRRFPVDAAILFSDILVVPAAMGMEIEFLPAPSFAWTVKSRSDIERLVPPDVGTRLRYVAEALKLIRSEVGATHAVLGFSGAPYTLACYMVDGTGAKGFVRTRALMHSDPEGFHQLLARVSDAVADYLAMQVEAGVTAFQLFDTWAGDLGCDAFEEFAAPYVARIIERVGGKGASSIYYVNGIAPHVRAAASTGADVLGVDWRVPIADVRQQLIKLGGATLPRVQGNLDPTALFGHPETIQKKVDALLQSTGGQGHIVNLGHGLMPDTPLAGIEAFVRSVTAWRSPRVTA
jgi:uroporphyrinogen decarboxylase